VWGGKQLPPTLESARKTSRNRLRWCPVGPWNHPTNQEVAGSSPAGRATTFRFIPKTTRSVFRPNRSDPVAHRQIPRGRPRGRAFAWQTAWQCGSRQDCDGWAERAVSDASATPEAGWARSRHRAGRCVVRLLEGTQGVAAHSHGGPEARCGAVITERRVSSLVLCGKPSNGTTVDFEEQPPFIVAHRANHHGHVRKCKSPLSHNRLVLKRRFLRRQVQRFGGDSWRQFVRVFETGAGREHFRESVSCCRTRTPEWCNRSSRRSSFKVRYAESSTLGRGLDSGKDQIALLKLQRYAIEDGCVINHDAGWHRAFPDPVHVNRRYLAGRDCCYLPDSARKNPGSRTVGHRRSERREGALSLHVVRLCARQK